MNAPMIISPCDIVMSRYQLPFEPYAFQREAIEALADLPRTGLYLEPGLGKTSVATACALYRMEAHGTTLTIVIMPPILIPNWCRYLRSIKRDGKPLDVLAYQGSPTQRKAMTFKGYDFVCMSMNIFKLDYDRINELCGQRTVHIIVDEAVSIKNVTSQSYRKTTMFALERSIQLLTGTPLNNPGDAYAYIKIVAPTIYRTLYQFENIHVAERDFFLNVKKWANLDMLKDNLMCNAVRRIKEEVLLDLPPLVITPMYYDLDSAHAKLYKRLAEEQLLRFADGTKLDATNVSALVHALGQIVCNYEHFAKDDKEARIFELIDETLEELGDKKLIVFTNYRMTSRHITERYAKTHHAVGIWGEISPKQKEVALQKFINDPKCRVFVLQQNCAGIDGLQQVCSDCIFIEVPSVSSMLEQAYSRLYRDGQKLSVNARIAVANGTLQIRTLKSVSLKQDLVNSIQNGLSNLKAAVFGN